MKARWERRTLAGVSAIDYGYTDSASQAPVGPRFLRITDIQADCVDWERVPYCRIASADLAKHRLHGGDIVFARTGATTGKSFLVRDPPEAVCASYLIRLRLVDETLSPEFVSLFFQTNDYWKAVKDGSTGSAQGGFNATKLGALSIPIPPVPEQNRIVGILAEAFEAIATAKANAERNLQNARALFESQLSSVIAEAWRTCELGTLSELATDITDGDHLPPPKAATGVPFITISNIVKDTRKIDFTDTFMVPHSYFDALKESKKPRRGDLLYTVTGSFGIPVIVDGDVEFCFQRHIGLVRPKAETMSLWLYYLLLSPQIVKQAQEQATGTAQKTVSLKVLRGFTVPKFPLAKQRAAVARLDTLSEATQRLKSNYQRKLAALDALKKSLLHRAFSGQL